MRTNLLFIVSATAVPVAACSGKAVTNGTDGVGGATTTNSTSSPSGGESQLYEECIDWPSTNSSSGGSGGADGRGGKGGAGGADGSGGLGGNSGTMDNPCPGQFDAGSYIPSKSCGITVQSGPVEKDGKCCYQVTMNNCAAGRPFFQDDVAVQAKPVLGQQWLYDQRPSLDDLSSDVREVLATEWLNSALAEHASVASFARFALELYAIGAPPELIAEAHQSARDEVDHALRCFALASEYSGRLLAAGDFPLPPLLELSSDLHCIVRRTIIEGCIGETLAAVHAQEQRCLATDHVVRETLRTIAEDEARHASLAWRTVAWACRKHPSLRGELVAMFQAGRESLTREATPARVHHDPALEAHGHLAPQVVQNLRKRAFQEIIWPCVEALCADTDHALTDPAAKNKPTPAASHA